ncbi:hypothetical protein B0H34DRAFT_710639, partial [Crassisporium funariophilum]
MIICPLPQFGNNMLLITAWLFVCCGIKACYQRGLDRDKALAQSCARVSRSESGAIESLTTHTHLADDFGEKKWK